jgi:release factor glutamine methyltransferase
MTLRDALSAAAAQLAGVSATPRLDAELLAAFGLGISRDQLLLSGLEGSVPPDFAALVGRRLAHEPVAYIIGERDFWTLSLKIGAGVLVPRPDSETLIEAAIKFFHDRPPASILDLGTGSGALLLAALSHWPEAKGVGVDRSSAALTIAQINADACRLGNRTTFQSGDWGEGLDGLFDLILCNPPYIKDDVQLPREVADYEPLDALYAGPDGLNDYRRLALDIPRLLSPAGCACLEIGYDQGRTAASLFEGGDLRVEVLQDLGGRDRCLRLTRKA